MGKHWTLLLAAGLLSSSLFAGEAEDLKIEDAWVRALPPTQKVTAAYLTVSNPGPAAVTITGGKADLAAEVQIHSTREIDGYTRMERLQQLEDILHPLIQEFVKSEKEKMASEGKKVAFYDIPLLFEKKLFANSRMSASSSTINNFDIPFLLLLFNKLVIYVYSLPKCL